eukprot:m.4494 g.4494  ORF g.4494 m.4494 type:complete len:118 (-) comp4503_c0_seq1:222-575(-)
MHAVKNDPCTRVVGQLEPPLLGPELDGGLGFVAVLAAFAPCSAKASLVILSVSAILGITRFGPRNTTAPTTPIKAISPKPRGMILQSAQYKHRDTHNQIGGGQATPSPMPSCCLQGV